jgi:acetyl-CoA acyltransferase
VFVLGGDISRFFGARHPEFIYKKHPDFGKKENPTLEEYITTAVNGALDKTGVPAKAVQKSWIGNFVGELFCNQGHLGAAVAGAHPDLVHKPSMRVEGACASGGLAYMCAVDAIKAGTDVALVVGAEVQTTASARTGGDYLARASHYTRQRELDDFVFPAVFARRIKGCSEAYGMSHDDLAHVSVKAYENANKNPLAHMHHVKMDYQSALDGACFLGNEELNPFLKTSDCSQVSDGASAMILVSEEGLKSLGKSIEDTIEVLGVGQACDSLYTDGDPLQMPCSKAAIDQAYAMSGVGIDQVGVAEVHDCFTVTELLMMEAMGLTKMGESAAALKDGLTAINGKCAINTGGGLVGFGHPVGATGVKQVLEVYRQMKGQCADYQVCVCSIS